MNSFIGMIKICVQTLNLRLFVHWYKTIPVRRRLVRGVRCGVKQGQQRLGQVLTHFSGAEVGVGPLVCVVAEGEFGERTSSKDGGVAGAEGVVNDQPVVKDQEGAADALEGVVVDAFVGQVDENLKPQNKKQQMSLLNGKIQF